MLQSYDFPGNIRELKNIIEHAVIESNGKPVRPHHLHLLRSSGAATEPDSPAADASALPLNLKQAEEHLIQRALDQTDGNIAAAARLLGTNRPRIYKFLEDKNSAQEHGSR